MSKFDQAVAMLQGHCRLCGKEKDWLPNGSSELLVNAIIEATLERLQDHKVLERHDWRVGEGHFVILDREGRLLAVWRTYKEASDTCRRLINYFTLSGCPSDGIYVSRVGADGRTLSGVFLGVMGPWAT